MESTAGPQIGTADRIKHMSFFGTPAPVESNGSDLLDEFEEKQAALVAEYRGAAADRADVVRARLAALEAEAADLDVLEAKIASIATAA